MLVTEKINTCNIIYDDAYSHSSREYYLYCVQLFKDQPLHVANIIFGEFDHNFQNDLPVYRIVFQNEHTLVKSKGRDSDGFPVGKIPYSDTESYLVRLCNYNALRRADVIVEYSLPNKVNVDATDFYPHYTDHSIHISPCLYDIDFSNNRPIDAMTNFYDITQPRRHRLLHSTDAINYTNVYGGKLSQLYSNSKVLINIHQTDHHDTLEELRVLPALRRGVLIVAEKSALQELVPYSEYIIWTTYDDVPSVVEEVLQNYEHYRKKIFNDSLTSLLKDIEKTNQTEVRRVLSDS